MRLSFIRVSSWTQALILREVRNSCREGMTHNTEEVSIAQQEEFWKKLVKPNPEYECYLLTDDSRPVGYGLLKLAGDKYWMTAGIVPEYRGKRLSRLIINYITEMGHRAGLDVWIDVYDDNLALIGDIRNGYEFIESRVDETGKILHIMKHNRERILRPKEAFKLFEKTGRKSSWVDFSGEEIAKEMIEVDEISREALTSST